MSATKEQLISILDDIKALGYDLSVADDKSAIYTHIVSNSSSYTLETGEIIENISIKHLFWLYANQAQPSRLAPKR